MNNYFNEINSLIENLEVNKKIREYKNNSETLETYWNIGKLLYEVGLDKNKYGSNFIKEWGNSFKNKYGSSYDYTNLTRMKKFYMIIPNIATAQQHLNWSHIKTILPIKNENERNYYINQVIINNLSTRELESIIKSDSFNRLSYKDKNNIEIINDNNYELSIEDMIKDPIILNINNNDDIDEKVLHKLIIDLLENKFLELGVGFTLAGHEYKINVDNKTYRLDLLFFNYKLNAFVVIEVKLKEVMHKDISQIDFYCDIVDKYIKEDINNKTIGLLLVKKKNKLILEYATKRNIFISTYKLNTK